jgi:biotin operon repressor
MYGQVPESLLAAHPTAATITVYIHLDLIAGRRGYWYCAQAEIAEATGLSRRSVERAIPWLRERGFITTTRQRHERDVYRYDICSRQERRHVPTELAAPPAKIGGNSRSSPYKDHREQPQSSTAEHFPMDHGAYTQFISGRKATPDA